MIKNLVKNYRSRIITLIFFSLILLPLGYSQPGDNDTDLISIEVNLDIEKGPLMPIWAFFGHDEPNYTYMKDGKKLLTEISELSPVPVYLRIHNILNTGDGTPDLKWGSSNAYTEDENGNPIYSWTIIDQIFDTYVERGMKPLAQIGFMPKALSTNPEPYKRVWSPNPEVRRAMTSTPGWAYPPTDYEKFAALVFEWVKHSIERYGKEEVESWLWEVWNEPDGGFWRGTTEEYIKLYDYSADAVKRALPTAIVGGPHTTGPGGERGATFLKEFLDHIVAGKNFATGETGAPIDFIAFHAKGRPALVDGVIQMDMGKQLRDINKGFEIVASYPTLKHLPIIIGESDPEGCAACSEEFNPQNAYRNGTLYSSYTAASFSRKHDLAEAWGINFRGAVTWAFEFEDQPWFAGFRDLATNGVDKPVLNVFRMFGMMKGERVGVRTDSPYNYLTIRDSSVRGEVPDINALAAKDDNAVTVLVWNYHDVNIIQAASPVVVKINDLSVDQVTLSHYRIDQEFSNSYEVWKKMGSPQSPSPEQYAELEEAGQLQLMGAPELINTRDGEVAIDFQLPGQGVSLLKISW
jgi:xylan 1,4-beta-xylosidase